MVKDHTQLGPDYMESFSLSCRCLTHLVKALVKSNYDYMEKVSAWIVEVKFQPGLGKPGSRPTELKISHVIVFSPGWNRMSIHSLLEFQPRLKFSLWSIFSTWAAVLQVIAINFHPGYGGWDFSPDGNSLCYHHLRLGSWTVKLYL